MSDEPTVNVKLYGEDAEWFEELKAEVTEQRGFEPTNAEMLRLMMAQVPRREEGQR